jgi:hypothetical protein
MDLLCHPLVHAGQLPAQMCGESSRRRRRPAARTHARNGSGEDGDGFGPADRRSKVRLREESAEAAG